MIEANAELQKAMQTLDGFDPEGQSELEEVANSAKKRAEMIQRHVSEEMQKIENN